MDGFAAVDFEFARQVLQRGIAGLYLVAFVSTLNQFRPLLGERGLLPAPDLLEWASSSKRAGRLLGPTVFRWIRYTDRRLVALCTGGIVVAATLVCGIPQLGPPWVPMIAFLLLWLGYMSITSIGQTFYSFGWEMLLLEAGFLAAFLGSDSQPPSTVVIVLFWWLVFRLEFGAGMIKIRGGREWRDLTALTYHHETQPMPGPLSRQAHLLPRWFHKGEVIGNHFAQLVVPWFLFAPILGLWVPGSVPAIVGAVAAAIVIATQLWLVATGNFAWLNWATIVIAFSAVGVPGIGASSQPLLDDPALGDRRHAAAVAHPDRCGRRALPGAELAGPAQPVRAAAAHECQLQPLAARQRVRSLRHGHQGAHRDRRGGNDRRDPGCRRLAGVRVQGEAR